VYPLKKDEEETNRQATSRICRATQASIHRFPARIIIDI
jgi:hypothetical protein